MKNLFRPMALIVLLVLSISAQKSDDKTAARPNFSGTWELVAIKNPKISDRVLVITHNGDELTVEDNFIYDKKPMSNRYTIYTDNRGEENAMKFPNADGPTKIRSKTEWEKGKVVRRARFETPIRLSGENMAVANFETQTFSLSPDGNELTIQTTGRREVPIGGAQMGVSTAKATYRRKD